MLKQPGGRTRFISSADAQHRQRRLLADFTTTVLPATSAGAIFSAISSIGTFHGMMAPTTPSGSRTVTLSTSGANGTLSPFSSPPSPPKNSRMSATFCASMRLSVRSALPVFQRDQPGQFLGMRAQHGAALRHQRAALAGGQPRPCLLRPGGVLHRGLDIGGVALGGTGDLLPGGRVDHREAGAGGGRRRTARRSGGGPTARGRGRARPGWASGAAMSSGGRKSPSGCAPLRQSLCAAHRPNQPPRARSHA